MSTKTPMTSSSVKAIMTKRVLVALSSIGRSIFLTIQGNGNVIDVIGKDGQPVLSTIKGQEGTLLQKHIFNCKAASQLAMADPFVQGLFKSGLAAEKAGGSFVGKLTRDDKEVAAAHTADEYFSEYLNRTQISFGVLLPNAKAEMISDGVEIAAKVQEVVTDNGKLLTVDASTIRVVEPEVAANVSFDVSMFEETAVPAEGITAPAGGL